MKVQTEVNYILDTKKENNVIIHFVKELPGFIGYVEHRWKQLRTSSNHSYPFITPSFKRILGMHEKRICSSFKYLRFDFSHFAKLTSAEIKEVESFVNARIESKLPLVEKRNIPMDDAIADVFMALFGETAILCVSFWAVYRIMEECT